MKTNRVLKLIAIAFITIALSACLEPTVEVVDKTDAVTLVESLSYVKAKNGLCFGVGLTSRLSTGGHMSYTNQLVNIPCEQVGL